MRQQILSETPCFNFQFSVNQLITNNQSGRFIERFKGESGRFIERFKGELGSFEETYSHSEQMIFYSAYF